MTENVFFGADYETMMNGVPVQYTWFATIINAKMAHMRFDLNNPFLL